MSIEILQGSDTVAMERWGVFVIERPISQYPPSEKLPCLVELAHEDTQ